AALQDQRVQPRLVYHGNPLVTARGTYCVRPLLVGVQHLRQVARPDPEDLAHVRRHEPRLVVTPDDADLRRVLEVEHLDLAHTFLSSLIARRFSSPRDFFLLCLPAALDRRRSRTARTRAGSDLPLDVIPGQASDHQRDARDQGQEAHGQGIAVALQASPPSVTGTVKALRRERTRRRSRPGRTGTSSRPAAAGTPRP